MKEKILFSLIILVALGGIYFIFTSFTYLYGYFTDTTSTVRNEYIGGAILSAIIALPFWLLISGLAYPIRKSISGRTYWAINAPSIILGIGFIIMNIYIFYMAAMGK